MIEDFSPRGVYYLEITCGENVRAALDYTHHYRSPHMIGIDADYAMSRAYRSQGWPRFLVIDQEGVVRFHGFPSDKTLTELRKCLEGLLSKTAAAPAQKPVLDRGIAFPADVLACRQARRDRSPRLAFDQSGNPHVVYYSNREGTNAVFLRRFNPKAEAQADERLSPPNAESYAADCAFDPAGTLWVTWCAGRTGFYDIFVQSRPEGREPVTQQLTFSSDDAMSPKIATGPEGTVTVTYYKWHMLWGSSRDRDIYARTLDPASRAWRPEIEINPHEPEVEDHTDPDVVIDRQSNAWIVWSYDYHPKLYKKPVDAEQPTIFAARFGANTVSSPLLVGATGQFRDAIDLFPSAAIDGQGTLWCAWDCSEPRRCIRLARLDQASDQFQLVKTFGKADEVCSTPELSAAATNCLLLTWSQRVEGKLWQGKVTLLKDGNPIAETARTENADVLFPQAQQSPDGEYWVTYERSDAKSSQVVLRNITQPLRRSQSPVPGL